MSPIWYIIIPLYLACWILVPIAAVWAMAIWLGSETKFEAPRWRSYLATGAFGLGGLSVLLWFFLAIWAFLRGGFRFYDPVLLRSYGIGLLLGLGGFITSLPGKGKLRWPACFVSFAMVFMWLIAASME